VLPSGRALLALATSVLVACAASEPPPKSPPAPTPPEPAATTASGDEPAAPPSIARAFAEAEPSQAFVDVDRKKKLASAFAGIDAIVDDEMSRQKMPGVAVGIVIDGELAYAKGFGFADVEKKTVPDADTVFRIGSITKSFTSLAILALRDDGALGLDDLLTNWIP